MYCLMSSCCNNRRVISFLPGHVVMIIQLYFMHQSEQNIFQLTLGFIKLQTITNELQDQKIKRYTSFLIEYTVYILCFKAFYFGETEK